MEKTTENIKEKYPVINYVCNPSYYNDSIRNYYTPISNIDSNVSEAYRTSMTEIANHASSSGSGGRRRIFF